MGYSINVYSTCLSPKDADSLIVLSRPCDSLGAVLRKYVRLLRLVDMWIQFT